VVQHCLLPIGNMSREAVKAREKDIARREQDTNQFRLRHSREDSRLHRMSDVFGRLIVVSDPLVSSLEMTVPQKHQIRLCVPPEARALLVLPDGTENDTDSDDEDYSEGSNSSDEDCEEDF